MKCNDREDRREGGNSFILTSLELRLSWSCDLEEVLWHRCWDTDVVVSIGKKHQTCTLEMKTIINLKKNTYLESERAKGRRRQMVAALKALILCGRLPAKTEDSDSWGLSRSCFFLLSWGASSLGGTPNLHFPHLHQTQIYTNPKFTQTQIYTGPIFTQPRFTQIHFRT